MNTKHSIEVRKYAEDKKSHTVVETISRTLRAEAIGNFNPIFCTYKGNKRCLVKSDEGDLSDPFRRTETYLRKLYIEV